MDLPHRSPHHLGAALASGVLHDKAGRKIAHHDTLTALAALAALAAHCRPDGKRERVVFPDRFPGLVDNRQAVDVRIDRDSERGARTFDQRRQPAEVLRNRFRRSWETAVRLEVDARDLAAKPLEQLAHWRAARPATRVKR